MASKAPVSGPRYSKEEFARRGDALYDEKIKPRLEKNHRGEFVSIDIETGDFEIDPVDMKATQRLLARLPDAQIWFRRIGFPYAHRFGPRPRRTRS
jgi:hypothetical protein